LINDITVSTCSSNAPTISVPALFAAHYSEIRFQTPIRCLGLRSFPCAFSDNCGTSTPAIWSSRFFRVRITVTGPGETSTRETENIRPVTALRGRGRDVAVTALRPDAPRNRNTTPAPVTAHACPRSLPACIHTYHTRDGNYGSSE